MASNVRILSLPELLNQTEIWLVKDNDGHAHAVLIAEMGIPHLRNLQSWLIDNAARIQGGAISELSSMASLVTGEQASFDLEVTIGRLEEDDPEEWIREQPLFEAITARLEAQGVHEPPRPPRSLGRNERVQLAHELREMDTVILAAIRALEPANGMSIMTTAQWNAQVDSLAGRLERMRRA